MDNRRVIDNSLGTKPMYTQPNEPDRGSKQDDVQTSETEKQGSTTPGPAPESIVSESVLVSPTGKRYRVLRTNERDAYDQPEANPTGEH
jgi:hypothetical protein